jgi:choline dehydrogenase-like flavoprotein
VIVAEVSRLERTYPVVVIGTGFGSLFFVHRLLQLRPDAKVLMLERGSVRPWQQQVAEGRNSAIDAESTYVGSGMHKPWFFTVAYGGGTNCWYGTTPRMHPNDLRLRTLYGRGQDWPISYRELEPYYAAAEAIMDISGPDDMGIISPRTGSYPQPPHKFSAADRVMKKAQPDLHFALPTARARVANAQRPRCCASFKCELCPVGAKFTALNGFRHVAANPNVRILPGADVLEIERSSATSVSSVRFQHGGRDQRIGCDLCVLGANAIHSPAILLRSGIDHPLLGRGLNEQLGYFVEVMLGGLDNLDGSTISTGANYALYDGPFRSEYGAALLIFDNRFPYGLRTEFGRWRQMLVISIEIEEEPLDENRVSLHPSGKPLVHFARHSPYAELAVTRTWELLPKVLAPLPVEKIVFRGRQPSTAHFQGTIRMGRTRADSVVDAGQVHHDIRNLIVVGNSVMPTCRAVAPSLTTAALSLRAADLAFA